MRISCTPGDASIVELVQGPVEFVDTRNNKRSGKAYIKPLTAVLGGMPFEGERDQAHAPSMVSARQGVNTCPATRHKLGAMTSDLSHEAAVRAAFWTAVDGRGLFESVFRLAHPDGYQLMDAPLGDQEWMVQVTALDRRMMSMPQLLSELQSGKLSNRTAEEFAASVGTLCAEVAPDLRQSEAVVAAMTIEPYPALPVAEVRTWDDVARTCLALPGSSEGLSRVTITFDLSKNPDVAAQAAVIAANPGASRPGTSSHPGGPTTARQFSISSAGSRSRRIR